MYIVKYPLLLKMLLYPGKEGGGGWTLNVESTDGGSFKVI